MLGEFLLGRQNESFLDLRGQLPGRGVFRLKFQQPRDLENRGGNVLSPKGRAGFHRQNGDFSPAIDRLGQQLRMVAVPQRRRHDFQRPYRAFVVELVHQLLPLVVGVCRLAQSLPVLQGEPLDEFLGGPGVMVQAGMVHVRHRTQQGNRLFVPGFALQLLGRHQVHLELLGLLVDGRGQIRPATAAKPFARRTNRVAMDARLPKGFAALGAVLVFAAIGRLAPLAMQRLSLLPLRRRSSGGGNGGRRMAWIGRHRHRCVVGRPAPRIQQRGGGLFQFKMNLFPNLLGAASPRCLCNASRFASTAFRIKSGSFSCRRRPKS